jgi:glycosyltransferase involved in cell wall biosynthesis
LTSCLESVAAQEFSDWEVVVVDDASTDGDVEQVVSDFDDPRCRTIRHSSNRGPGAARNSGFRNAHGTLVLPVDSDDLLHPQYLAKTIDVFKSATDADFVYTDFQLFGESNEVWRFGAPKTVREMLHQQWIPGPGTLMRRCLWERVGGYSEAAELVGNEDWDFWLSALASGAKPVHIPLPLYFYRRHGSSISSVSLRYDEFVPRDFIYLRHRALFDRHKAGGEFRARGYLNSARFAWGIRERRHALVLGYQGLTTSGVTWPFVRAAVRAFARRCSNVWKLWSTKTLTKRG